MRRSRAVATEPAAPKPDDPQPADARGIGVVYRPLRALIPYARNARTHTGEQIGKIRASLARFGWTNPMLTAEDQMIAGHARLQAAMAMFEAGEAIPNNPDPSEGPTVDLSHLSLEDRRAYVIADNRLAEDAGWDTDILRVEMDDLASLGYDLAATGFTAAEIGEILVRPGRAGGDGERELSPLENDMLDVAWRRLIGEWSEIVLTSQARSWISSTFTRGALAVTYLRALFLGDDIPRGATIAYTGNRIFTSGDKYPIDALFNLAVGEEKRTMRNGIRFVLAERPSFDKMLVATSLPVHGYRLPNDFPAQLARDLIDEFMPQKEGHMLDPCHGWGGRMLGFLLSEQATHYHGFDPSPQTSRGVQSMFDDLSALTPHRTKTARLEMMPFERANLAPDAYDFALTSPPYFDTEQYDGEDQSFRQYPTFETWRDRFFLPMIASVSKALKPGGIFALQVGSQSYPLRQVATDHAPGFAMTVAEIRNTAMINNWAGTEANDGEVVIILRKNMVAPSAGQGAL